ncbi:MAG: hypothetical protein OEZ47_16805 [Gammaproteobacteria bacterium]|nr:hypothetical protein [Gammaproteobacteria bacterium]
MRLTVNLLKGLAVALAVFLAACASTPSSDESATAAESTEAAAEPASPVADAAAEAAATETAEAAPAAEPAPAAAKKPGVTALVEKMKANPATLYWRDTATFSFYLGGTVEAEYKPGDSLVLKDDSGAENAVECNFAMDGGLKGAAANTKACETLMFTLDSALD